MTGIAISQPLNPRDCPVDDSGEFAAKFGRAILLQASLGLLGREPGSFSLGFPRRRQFAYLAKIGVNNGAGIPRLRPAHPATIMPPVAREGYRFDSAVHSGFFHGFESCGLGTAVSGFDAALGKNPPATPGLNEKEFNGPVADPITDGGNLFSIPANLRTGPHANRVRDQSSSA